MKTQLAIFFLVLAYLMKSQTLQQAIIKTDNERYDAAVSDFVSLLSREPSKGENYFYFGENYFNKGDLDSANIQYQKGTEVNATNPLNYVGLGKVLLYKGKEADAKTQFYKAATLGAGKHGDAMRKTAEAYINAPTKNLDEAMTLINNAIKLDAKNSENYILLGDALLEKNPTDGGPSVKQYQKASELNSKSPIGLLRQGKLYGRGRNYQLALDLYKKAIELDPTFAPAYREIAEIYFLAGQNAKSIDNWKKYLELNNSNHARYRYMNALFNNKQYTDAINEGESLKKNGYNNFTTERLLGWSYGEMGNKNDTTAYSKGLRSMNQFFDMVKSMPNFKFYPGDYKYKGVLLAKMGKDSLGVIEIEKAIALDAAGNCELWSEVAKIWMKSKSYIKAIGALEKKSTCAKGLTGEDNFMFGRAYYNAAGAKQREAALIKEAKAKQAKEAESVPLFINSDSCFSKLTQMSPNFPAGYFWRGRVNSYLDPTSEKGLAKPFYEKALSIVKPEEKTSTYKKETIESLEYLGYFFVLTKDKEKADALFNELKTLDPNNEKQKNYFAPPKPKGK